MGRTRHRFAFLVGTLVAASFLMGWVTDHVRLPPGLDDDAFEEGCGLPLRDGERPAGATTAPRGRAIGILEPAACAEALRGLGVEFEAVPSNDAAGVAAPIRLPAALEGVRIDTAGGDPRSVHTVLDCRLALALQAWATNLRALGIRRIEHASMYRPNARVRGSGRVSGHAHGLAIDVMAFILEDGTRLSVLGAWADRARGPIPARGGTTSTVPPAACAARCARRCSGTCSRSC